MKPRIRPCEKFSLMDQVRQLSGSLNRPVCSKDLIEHWKTHPDIRPALLQAPGQLLAKCARPKRWGRIHNIGIIGNLAYYAPDMDPHWFERLEVHQAATTLKTAARLRVPDYAADILEDHEELALNALRGWVKEICPLTRIDELQSHVQATALPRMMEMATSVVGPRPKFTGNPPVDLIDSTRAAVILRREYEHRTVFGDAAFLSINKHLARINWPRTSLFAKVSGHSHEEIMHYVIARWPQDDDDPWRSKAVFSCMAYGRPPAWTSGFLEK